MQGVNKGWRWEREKVPVRAAVEPARGSMLVVDFAIKSVNMHCSQEVMAVTVSEAQRQESLAAQV